MIHITAFNISFDIVNKIPFLKKVQIVYLKVDKVFIEIISKYIDFIDVFLLKLTVKLPEHININNHSYYQISK